MPFHDTKSKTMGTVMQFSKQPGHVISFFIYLQVQRLLLCRTSQPLPT